MKFKLYTKTGVKTIEVLKVSKNAASWRRNFDTATFDKIFWDDGVEVETQTDDGRVSHMFVKCGDYIVKDFSGDCYSCDKLAVERFIRGIITEKKDRRLTYKLPDGEDLNYLLKKYPLTLSHLYAVIDKLGRYEDLGIPKKLLKPVNFYKKGNEEHNER